MDDSQRFGLIEAKDAGRQAADSPPARRASSNGSPAPKPPSNMQRALSAVRSTLPFIQRILPLLDGNIGSAVSNLLAPHSHTLPHPSPVNVTPILDGLAELQAQNLHLRNQIAEQNSSLKRVEEQLESVRDATDRNRQEQQELQDNLDRVGRKVTRFGVLAAFILGLSILLNVILLLHFKGALRQ